MRNLLKIILNSEFISGYKLQRFLVSTKVQQKAVFLMQKGIIATEDQNHPTKIIDNFNKTRHFKHRAKHRHHDPNHIQTKADESKHHQLHTVPLNQTKNKIVHRFQH